MPSWGQDTVAVLTFQAEGVPVLAQGAHLLRCGEQGGTGTSGQPSQAAGALLSPSAPSCSPEAVWSVSRRPAPSRQSAMPHRRNGGLGSHPLAAPRVLQEPGGPVFSPSSARASPKKTGCWQRGQVQLMAPLKAAGSAHRGHPTGTPFRPLCWLHPWLSFEPHWAESAAP